MGDFNFDIFDNNNYYGSNHLLHMMMSYDFKQLIKVPTQITSESVNLLDHMCVMNNMLNMLQSPN